MIIPYESYDMTHIICVLIWLISKLLPFVAWSRRAVLDIRPSWVLLRRIRPSICPVCPSSTVSSESEFRTRRCKSSRSACSTVENVREWPPSRSGWAPSTLGSHPPRPWECGWVRWNRTDAAASSPFCAKRPRSSTWRRSSVWRTQFAPSKPRPIRYSRMSKRPFEAPECRPVLSVSRSLFNLQK